MHQLQIHANGVLGTPASLLNVLCVLQVNIGFNLY